MIDDEGNVKVLDFGLAAQIHTSMTRVSMASQGTGGTAPYMSPEQWRGRHQGAAADQYALAVMTYEMLAGHLPFESTDAAVLQQAVLTQDPEPIASLPKYAQAAIERAMSKDPANRFASCSDFVEAMSRKPPEKPAAADNGPVAGNGFVKRPSSPEQRNFAGKTNRFGDARNAARVSAPSPAPQTDSGPDLVKMIKRISILMHQDNWGEAESLCKRMLEIEPENAELYLMLCMIHNRVSDVEALQNVTRSLADDKDFQVALQFAPRGMRENLDLFLRENQTRNRKANQENVCDNKESQETKSNTPTPGKSCLSLLAFILFAPISTFIFIGIVSESGLPNGLKTILILLASGVLIIGGCHCVHRFFQSFRKK